jgi:hypothetical protein
VVAGHEDDGVDRPAERPRRVEVRVAERPALRRADEVRAALERQAGPGRQQPAARLGGDLELAGRRVDARDGDAVDVDGVPDGRDGARQPAVAGLARRRDGVDQRSDAQGSSSKTSTTS